MYKIAVLGERESVMGFAALGLAVFPVDSAEEAAEVFHRLTRQSDAYAIIYVTETYAEALHAQIERLHPGREQLGQGLLQGRPGDGRGAHGWGGLRSSAGWVAGKSCASSSRHR